MTATRAHKAFCLSYPQWYSEDYWGITASDHAAGYTAWGGPPAQGPLDGSGGSCAAAAARWPFCPLSAFLFLRAMRSKWGKQAWGRYGFVDAFHPAANWYDPDVLGIDQGISVLMAENLRSGLVWNTFMRNPEMRERHAASVGFQRKGVSAERAVVHAGHAIAVPAEPRDDFLDRVSPVRAAMTRYNWGTLPWQRTLLNRSR